MTFYYIIFVVFVFDAGHYKERDQGIFSMITFLKSVGSTIYTAGGFVGPSHQTNPPGVYQNIL